MDNLVLPMLGKGGTYDSMGKRLEIPAGHFTDFGDWSRLALMHNRRTLADLNKLQRAATDPAAIGRMIAVVENELGYPLYDAVARLKRVLSSEERAHFHFDSAGVRVEADVSRAEFEGWIAPDLARIGTGQRGCPRRGDRPCLPDGRLFPDPCRSPPVRPALLRKPDRQRR
jgi:hypothetical chaperone protein